MKKGLKIVAIITLVIMVGTGIFAAYVYRSVGNALGIAFFPIEIEDIRGEESPLILGEDPISILLLGIDNEGPDDPDQGRSDTIMFITINPEERSTKILSIPRDTRTEIVGRGFYDRINHAYAFGGLEMAVNTIQNYLNVPVDYYMALDMVGIQMLVDLIGGVTVDNNALEFSKGGHHFPIGTLHLNGEQALAFMRMRKEDPRGDFGRQDRNRMVLEALVRNLSSVPITKYQTILDTTGAHMRTDLTMNVILSLASNYRQALDRVDQGMLIGSGTMIDGRYFIIVPEEERLAASNELRQHLGLE